ncbi:hypothetical protein TeGR_g5501 [Tetraparma gracilis]|uniref:Uncharacterized protein n=1 Tax=Tetraparma gracilis TaxID=2962635 RepID=A0ABQ6MHM4_9STRA|nr:hypothetical protein TeGR_g5501 [Tetraparma gracilis]
MPVSSSSSFSTLLDVPFSEDNRPSFAEAQVLLNDFLAFVPLLHAQFARYDEIDALRRQDFVQSSLLAPSPPPITPGENMMVDVALASAGALNWKRLHGTVREPVGYFVAEHEEKDAAGWGRAESEVDASQEETLAWILDYASYRRTEIHEDHYGESDVTIEDIPKVIAANKYTKKAVMGTLRGFFRIQSRAPRVSRITFVLQGYAGGKIPEFVLKWSQKHTLSVASEVAEAFERNGVRVDKELRDALPLPPRKDDLNDEQLRVVDSCTSMERDLASIDWSSAKLKSFTAGVDTYAKRVKRGRGEKR